MKKFKDFFKPLAAPVKDSGRVETPSPGHKVEERFPIRILCLSRDCKMYNIEVDPSSSYWFDASSGMTRKYGTACPFCKKTFLTYRAGNDNE
jgi:hypothetical protein